MLSPSTQVPDIAMRVVRVTRKPIIPDLSIEVEISYRHSCGCYKTESYIFDNSIIEYMRVAYELAEHVTRVIEDAENGIAKYPARKRDINPDYSALAHYYQNDCSNQGGGELAEFHDVKLYFYPGNGVQLQIDLVEVVDD